MCVCNLYVKPEGWTYVVNIHLYYFVLKKKNIMAVLGYTPVTHTHKIHEAVGPAVQSIYFVTPTQRRENYGSI